MQLIADIVFYSLIFMLPLSILALGIIVAMKNNVRRKEKEENAKMNNSQHVVQAKLWHESLKELGENQDLEALIKLAHDNNVPDGKFLYKVLFSREELHVVLKQAFKERYKKLTDDGYGGQFNIDTLPVAVHVKRLAAYVLELRESLSMLEEKEKGFELSEKALEKKRQIEIEIVSSEEEISKYAYAELLRTDGTTRYENLEFYKFVAVEEEELLEMVDSKISGGKPVFKRKMDTSVTPTSPALEELNQFLSENKLPESVYKELQDTISDIQQKLLLQSRETEDENLLTEAKVLKQTARQFHDL